MKVFEVIVFSCYDFESSIITKIFSTKEKAKEYFEDRCEMAKEEVEELGEDGVWSHSDTCFDAYLDGRAIEWEIEITLEEKEVE